MIKSPFRWYKERKKKKRLEAELGEKELEEKDKQLTGEKAGMGMGML